MNVNYTFEQEETDSQNFYFYQKGFDKSELNKISKNVKKLPWNIVKTAGGETEVRDSNIKWIPQNEEWFWLYEKLANMASNSQ